MQNSITEATPSETALTPSMPTLKQFSSKPTRTLTKILLVQFRNGEAVSKHPELKSLLDDGWSIRSAVPRIVEAEGTKLLVVMAKPESGTRLTRVK